jgi:hypothetical protein
VLTAIGFPSLAKTSSTDFASSIFSAPGETSSSQNVSDWNLGDSSQDGSVPFGDFGGLISNFLQGAENHADLVDSTKSAAFSSPVNGTQQVFFLDRVAPARPEQTTEQVEPEISRSNAADVSEQVAPARIEDPITGTDVQTAPPQESVAGQVPLATDESLLVGTKRGDRSFSSDVMPIRSVPKREKAETKPLKDSAPESSASQNTHALPTSGNLDPLPAYLGANSNVPTPLPDLTGTAPSRVNGTKANVGSAVQLQSCSAGPTVNPFSQGETSLPPTRESSSDISVFDLTLRASNTDENTPRTKHNQVASISEDSSDVSGVPKPSERGPAARFSSDVEDSFRFYPSAATSDSANSEGTPPKQGSAVKGSPLLKNDRVPETNGDQKSELNLWGASSVATNSSTSTSLGAASKTENGRNLNSPQPIQPKDLQGVSTDTPTREFTVRLQGHSGETISVRLSDQGGGQVQIAVRSSDPSAASALRQDLSALANNLDRVGWKAENSSAPTISQSNPGQDQSNSGQDSSGRQRQEVTSWEEQGRKDRHMNPDLWDELLDKNAS